MTDTASFEAIYSEQEEEPAPPTVYPTTPGAWTPPSPWTDDPSVNSIWMATATKHNGVWTDWVVTKIKGEKGEDGVGALQLTCSYSSVNVNVNSLGSLDPSSVLVRSLRGGVAERVYFTVFGKPAATEADPDPTPVAIDPTDFYATRAMQWSINLNKVSSYKTIIFRGYVKSRSTSWSTAPDSECSLNIVYDGKNGSAGPMPMNRGKWSESEVYVYNDEYRDFVWTEGGKVYIRENRGAVCPAGTPLTNTDYWAEVPKTALTAIDTALIDNANIAGFIFHRKDIVDGVPIGRLLSQNETLVLDAQYSSIWLGESGKTIEMSASERAIKLTDSNNKQVGKLGFFDGWGTLELTSDSGYTKIIGNVMEIKDEYGSAVSMTSESVTVAKGGYSVFISEEQVFIRGIDGIKGNTVLIINDRVQVSDGKGNLSVLSPGKLKVTDSAGGSATYDTSGGSGTGGGSGDIDQKVVEGSANAVSGGAVYTALQQKIQTIKDPTEAKYSGVLYIIH